MTTLKIVLAIIVGFLAGSLVNTGLITIGSHVIAPPPGVDLADMESLKAAMPTLGAKYFIFPFLAHALGTLVGALVAILLTPGGRTWTAWVIGALFLCGGIVAAFMIPAPWTFIAADLLLAYIPMAWLAIQVRARLKPHATNVG